MYDYIFIFVNIIIIIRIYTYKNGIRVFYLHFKYYYLIIHNDIRETLLQELYK